MRRGRSHRPRANLRRRAWSHGLKQAAVAGIHARERKVEVAGDAPVLHRLSATDQKYKPCDGR
jgi:hypothetical protein